MQLSRLSRLSSNLYPYAHDCRTQIDGEDGIVAQLVAQGVEPAKLQATMLSCLHGDHTGGLQHILEPEPKVPVCLSHSHLRAFG
jgi:glyoxylase-like metal-dependent hydrolase (beta-lactamase superfamily II)